MASYSSFSDMELTALLKKGDHEAFVEIYNRFKAPLYVHAYNKLRNTEEAKDTIQELFTKLWNNRESLTLTHDLISYLYASVRNRVFRQIERKGLESGYISSIQDTIQNGYNFTDHQVREKQLSAIIEKEIEALPAKMKEVFVLSRKMNLSHKEIAEHLGIAEPTVKKQVNNALKILRVKLGIFVYLIFLLK
ncbi:RNA polymerase sigma-70 factor [Pedobacter sp.]|jgi:RNA polymerase sigma-70 factor (family 1)|uniref:RNA polymerase sigma factor n=1 Tax=Pedobacter sp. TaxID=1411316 RepID=UPI002D1446CF|nr:RNA polymerase sigma-70 factor [Pedobacter sp.]HWW41612.1 RNA polymerase sigma-70 factor [Pedobacter sp.]